MSKKKDPNAPEFDLLIKNVRVVRPNRSGTHISPCMGNRSSNPRKAGVTRILSSAGSVEPMSMLCPDWATEPEMPSPIRTGAWRLTSAKRRAASLSG